MPQEADLRHTKVSLLRPQRQAKRRQSLEYFLQRRDVFLERVREDEAVIYIREHCLPFHAPEDFLNKA